MCTSHHSHGHHHNHDHSHSHSAGSSCACGHHHHPHSSSKSKLALFLPETVTGILLAAMMVLSHFADIPAMILLAVYLLVIVPVALPVLRDAFRLWSEADFFNEFTLMLLASAGAFAIGEYPEAVAILLFYSFGEKLQVVVSDDVKGAVRRLLGKMPEKVSVIRDGAESEVHPRDVAAEEVIMVRPGESAALDGVLLGERSVSFDTSAMTGESIPRSFSPGDEISSGMIPLSSAVRLKVARPFSKSAMSRVMKLIEDASKEKAPAETILRRITRWYTPLVIACALLLLLVPFAVSLLNPGFTFVWDEWFRRSLVFLVCSCPCALIVSIPLAYFVALGLSSRKGILFKGHSQLDRMRKIGTMLFDKTGTVTTGRFRLDSINTYSSLSKDDALGIAAAVENDSLHPLAAAIREAAKGLSNPEVTDIISVEHGMRATLDGKSILAGSALLMRENGIALPEEPSATSVFLALDGNAVAAFTFSDELKQGAAEAFGSLRSLGVRRMGILSGDNEEAVKRAAKRTGMDFYRAELRPEQKLLAIDKKESGAGVVGFVGDGVNDAPALAKADLGIAMGRLGSDMAIETADIVIANDDLRQIPEGMKISSRVKALIIENVSFAFGVKAYVMIAGALGYASLWGAVFADTGVTLATVLWTLIRLKAWTLKK